MATSIDYLEKCLLNTNIQAAIATIRSTEGTSAPDGFHYLYGSSPRNPLRFTDLSQHPNIAETFNNITSTAAGIGQWLHKDWVWLSATYAIPDFSEHSQMLGFAAEFDSLNVLGAICNGGFLSDAVMQKLSGRWASLPDAKYLQPTHSIADCRAVYLAAGGTFSAIA